MALNYGPQELDRHIPSLAKMFQNYAEKNLKLVESLSKYEKLAIAEKFFRVELTERSLNQFVEMTDRYIERNCNFSK